MSLNKFQQLAKDHRQGNLLVSAGAGSGKTTVLAQRVIDLVVDENVPLSSLLILTFTNAAANNMKDKIRQYLLKLHRYQEANEVDASFIMTFDAYALFLVKKYHHIIGLDATLDIFEGSILQYQLQSTLNSILEQRYGSDDADFHAMIQKYVIKDDATLKAFILDTYHHIDLKPNTDSYLASYQAYFFSEGFIAQKITALFALLKEDLEQLKLKATHFEDSEEMERILEVLEPLEDCEDIDTFLLTLPTLKFKTTRGLSDDDKVLKTLLLETLKTFKLHYAKYPIAGYIEAYKATQKDVDALLSIISELMVKIDSFKRYHRRYSFLDIAKYATKLLDHPLVQHEVKNSLRYIMIDEYQDTSDIQETFIQKIANHNVFMVGDIKQSIYRFRDANSDIFADKLNQYLPYTVTDEHVDKVIHLNMNYRSRPEVIHAINTLFKDIMTLPYGGVNYQGDQLLVASLPTYDVEKDPLETYQIDHLSYQSSLLHKEKDEPTLIAKDILAKIAKGHQVYDDHSKSMRPMMFKDIALLLDRKTTFETYVSVFAEAGIPLQIYADRSVSSSDMYRLFRNILIVLQHGPFITIPKTLRKHVMSILRSFLFDLDDQAIFDMIQGNSSFTSTKLYTILQPLYALVASAPLFKIYKAIIEAFNVEFSLLRLEDITANMARLNAIQSMMIQLTALGYTLDQCVEYLENTEDLKIELTIQEGKQTENAVTLMTIHKSKGLEFPVVYFPGLNKAFNFSDTEGYYQVDNSIGIQFPYPSMEYKYSIFKDLIVFKERKETISEYIRLLYVALTRTREKMIFVYPTDKIKNLDDISEVKSFLDVLSLANHLQSIPTFETVDHLLSKVEKNDPDLPSSLTFDAVEYSFETQTLRRASKVISTSVSTSTLAYGQYVHECLFIIDFKTFKTDWIEDPSLKTTFDTLFTLPLFTSLKEKLNQGRITILKEYTYINSAGQKRMIDLVVKEGNDLYLLDYKTKGIDDPAYPLQLSIYADDLTALGFRVVSLTLVSILDAVIKPLPYPLSV
jgi:ATP-dependent helicase/nuclease subunit A